MKPTFWDLGLHSLTNLLNTMNSTPPLICMPRAFLALSAMFSLEVFKWNIMLKQLKVNLQPLCGEWDGQHITNTIVGRYYQFQLHLKWNWVELVGPWKEVQLLRLLVMKSSASPKTLSPLCSACVGKATPHLSERAKSRIPFGAVHDFPQENSTRRLS